MGSKISLVFNLPLLNCHIYEKIILISSDFRHKIKSRFKPIHNRYKTLLLANNYYLVHREGFEPPTLCSEDRCSNPLSYRCMARQLF